MTYAYKYKYFFHVRFTHLHSSLQWNLIRLTQVCVVIADVMGVGLRGHATTPLTLRSESVRPAYEWLTCVGLQIQQVLFMRFM